MNVLLGLSDVESAYFITVLYVLCDYFHTASHLCKKYKFRIHIHVNIDYTGKIGTKTKFSTTFSIYSPNTKFDVNPFVVSEIKNADGPTESEILVTITVF
jgi:hypothetical protein